MAVIKLSKKALAALKEQAANGEEEAIQKLAEYEKQQEEKERRKQERAQKMRETVRRFELSTPPVEHIKFEDHEFGSPIEKLTKDLKQQVTELTANDIRYLVDTFYQIQNNRIRSYNQVRASEELGEANRVLIWIAENNRLLENNIKKALDIFTDYHPVGRWLKSITGIGPVLAAGLLAYLDVTKSPTAGGFWRYAGLDPTLKWEKGEKRPWNADLKKLLWKVSDSFVKQSSRPSDFYGKLYLARKQYEHDKNERGEYAERAAQMLREKNFVADTITKKTYQTGKITDAHIDASARRYAAKIFLSHLHHVMYLHHYKTDPPKPFALAILGHAHMIEIPNLKDHYEDLINN